MEELFVTAKTACVGDTAAFTVAVLAALGRVTVRAGSTPVAEITPPPVIETVLASPSTAPMANMVAIGKYDAVKVVQLGAATLLITVTTWLVQVVDIFVPVAAAAPTMVVPFDPQTCACVVVLNES